MHFVWYFCTCTHRHARDTALTPARRKCTTFVYVAATFTQADQTRFREKIPQKQQKSGKPTPEQAREVLCLKANMENSSAPVRSRNKNTCPTNCPQKYIRYQ